MAACVLALPFAGCVSPPSPGLRDAGASGLSAGSAPRFAASGPDGEEYGAKDGYPIGDRSTFFQIPFLVGSHSHLDRVFEGRLFRRAATPSRLGRAESELAVRYEYQGEILTVDDYLARHPAPALLIARDETILLRAGCSIT